MSYSRQDQSYVLHNVAISVKKILTVLPLLYTFPLGFVFLSHNLHGKRWIRVMIKICALLFYFPQTHLVGYWCDVLALSEINKMALQCALIAGARWWACVELFKEWRNYSEYSNNKLCDMAVEMINECFGLTQLQEQTTLDLWDFLDWLTPLYSLAPSLSTFIVANWWFTDYVGPPESFFEFYTNSLGILNYTLVIIFCFIPCTMACQFVSVFILHYVYQFKVFAIIASSHHNN